jgi:long-subunit fatty acid transport protein
MEGWRLTFDVINHHYDVPFSGISDAYSLNGTVRYAISDSLTTNFSIDYSKTPDFLRNTTVLLNLVYNFKSGR